MEWLLYEFSALQKLTGSSGVCISDTFLDFDWGATYNER